MAISEPYVITAARLTAAHINLGTDVTLPALFADKEDFEPALKSDFNAVAGTIAFEYTAEGASSPTAYASLANKTLYAVRATATAGTAGTVSNFLATTNDTKVLLGFVQFAGGNASTPTGGSATATITERNKITWPSAPTTTPTYGGTFSLTVPKPVNNAGIGTVITVRYVNFDGAWEWKPGVNTVSTAMTVTAKKAGYWPLTTIVQTRLITGPKDDLDTTFYETMNTIWVTVNKKQLDAKWLTVKGTYTYNGYSQYDLLDYSVAMGTKEEDKLVAITDYEDISDPSKMIAKGTGSIVLKGVGNFDGTITSTFNILPKEVTVNLDDSRATDKPYDGKATIDTDLLWLPLEGAVGIDVLSIGTDYTINNARFASPNVTSATGADVTGTVTLVANGPVSKNYELKPASTPFTISGVKILEVDLDADVHFNYTIPTNHYYTGSRRGIGTVTWKPDYVANGASNFSVEYEYSEDNPLKIKVTGKPDSTYFGWSTTAPTDSGSYLVRAVVKEITNFPQGGEVDLGTYTIKTPEPAIIEPGEDCEECQWLTEVDTRKGVTTTLRIIAKSPNNGTLSYRWFRVVNDVASVISGQSGATYTFKPEVEGTQEFYVEVTNRVSGVQAGITVSTPIVTVTAYKAPILVNDAKIVFAEGALDDKIYHGGEQKFSDGEIMVMMPSEEADGEDWELTSDYYIVDYNNNRNAGKNASVRISFEPLAGIPGDGYQGSVSKTFEIKQKVTDGLDFLFQKDGRTFGDTGIEKGANVRPQEGTTGMGAITVFYDGESEIPLVAGVYSVEASVTAGTNYTATPEPVYVGRYEIRKRELVAKDLNYTLGERGQVLIGEGIGAVTVKESAGGKDFTGKITVVYGTSEELPVDVGSYEISFVVEGDANFESGIIDNVGSIDFVTVSIAQGGREVPNGTTSDVGAVAPVKGVAGTFSVGPSPAKAGDKVKFFWSGKALASGTILVYASTGELAKKISVKKVAGNELAVWSGASAGTYLAKAVLVGKDGKKETASFLFVVR